MQIDRHEMLKQAIRQKELMSEEVRVANPYIYAAIPLGVDPEVMRQLWGFTNKQLAMSNLEVSDVDSILNRLRITDLAVKSKMRRYQLREYVKWNNANYNNIRVYIMALASLGKGGFLIEEIGKSRKDVTLREEIQPKPSIKRKLKIGGGM